MIRHYFALLLILCFSFAAILFFRYDRLLLNLSIYSLGGLYVLWGIFHHKSLGHLRAKVVLEYFLVALLGIVIIKTLI